MSPYDHPPRLDQLGAARSVQAAEAVFFDFDGPLCDVFSGHPASGVAEALKTVAKGFGVDLPDQLESSGDPHGILRGLRQYRAGVVQDAEEEREFFAALEEKLAQYETMAASSAKPTPHAFELTTALHGLGKKLLVTSNNAPGAVWEHLRAESMHWLFDHVVGRDPGDPLLMKPDPYCVNRALELVRLPAEDCLLIGDQPSDAQAARAAGVPFLGYAPDEANAVALRAAGADLVTSLDDVLEALPPLP